MSDDQDNINDLHVTAPGQHENTDQTANTEELQTAPGDTEHCDEDRTEEETSQAVMKTQTEEPSDLSDETEASHTDELVVKSTKTNESAENQSDIEVGCEPSTEPSDLTVVMFGNTSAVCFGHENILLGEEQTLILRRREVSGREVSVINILDLHEDENSDRVESTTAQLLKENISSFLFVLQLGCFTDADKVGLGWLQDRFGESVLPFVMILFTYEREEDCDTIIDDLKNNPVLEQLVVKCRDRYHTCSKSMNIQSEMKTLLQKIDYMVSENNQHCSEICKPTSEKREDLQDKTQQSDEAPDANPSTAKMNTEEKSQITKEEKKAESELGAAEDKSHKYEEQQKLQQLFIKLNIEGNVQEKIKTADVLQITKSYKENDEVQAFIQKLLLMNYRARSGRECSEITETQVLSDAENDDKNDVLAAIYGRSFEAEVQSSFVHPMDVQMAVFHCSDSFLKQLIVTKLSQCQYALPLLVPNPFTDEIELPLWTFRQIRKSWKTSNTSNNTSKESNIVTLESPMVAFFRLGAAPTSKSQLMNSLINKKHDTFFHRNCPGSSRDRILMDGVVEIAWYLPSGKNTDHFTDCVAFCNLHGDGGTNEQQLDILTEMSSVNVVLLENPHNNDKRLTKLQKLYENPKPMICLLTDQSVPANMVKTGKYSIGLKDRNQSEVSEELTKAIREIISKPVNTFRLEEVAKRSGIKVDEELQDCKKAREAAKQTTILIEKEENPVRIKESLFPCQGRLWQNWCQKNKELHRSQDSISELKISGKQREMKKIREQQRACGLSPVMKLVIEQLNKQTADERSFYLKWINIFLDNYTSNLSSLHNEYDKKWSLILDLKKSHDQSGQLKNEQAELENISHKLNSAAFGLEHILREIGQIYESHTSVHNKTETERLVTSLPALAAELMISGHPMELMDGDAAHVPLIWVSAVLDELIKKIGDQRVFVLSVLGIQSSGKSTMLNAMFGLQFAVSAGRCTKGAFMQLVKVSEEMKKELKCNYILVVDTEGLRALELAGLSTRQHDNELATFVVGLGNMTLINIFGENPVEMQDILQIVVQAFLRMKQIRLSPSCMFVHQNVGDITAGQKNMEGRRRLQETLDEMTQLAAKEEVCEADCFSDVITFDVKDDVRYFSQLWEGSPPMAPPNPCYSECVQELKEAILEKASKSPRKVCTLSEFKTSLKDLWNALLHENFVFSFRNTLEITVYRKLETQFSKWAWNLRSTMLSTEDKLLNRIANGDLHVGEGDVVESMKEMKEEVTKSVKKYFEEDKDKDILVQWQNRFTQKIEELHDDLVKAAKRKLDEVVEQKKTKEKVDKKKTEYENKLFTLSKELALRLRHEETDETALKREFGHLWEKWITELTQNTPKNKDIEYWEDVIKILSESYELSLVHMQHSEKAYENIGVLGNYTNYTVVNKNDKEPEKSTKEQKTGFFNLKFVKPFAYVYNKFTKDNQSKNVDLLAEDNMSVSDLINYIIDKAIGLTTKIRSAQLGYNSGQVQEVTDFVINSVKKYQKKEQRRFTLKKEFTVDLCLYTCDLVKPTFVENHEQFRKTNDPEYYLENQKPQYYNVFRNFCQGATTTATFGELICSKLEPSILQAVYNQTALSVAADVKASSPAFSSNRSNMEKHILKVLAEKENFEIYKEYIHNPKQYFKKFIADQADKYISRESEKVKNIFSGILEDKKLRISNAVHVATVQVKKSDGNARTWLRCFSSTLRDELNLAEISSVDDMEIDFDFFSEILNKGLTNMMSKLHTSDINMEMFQKRSVETLIEHFCECCWVQCPFCKAICTNTLKNHDGDHSVPFHRANGINGWHYRETRDLCSDFCTTLVQSNKRFYVRHDSDECFPYKQYRTAGGKYATWSITPDSSELPYWKWFMCHFQKNLEDHYGKKFQGHGKIPEEWKKYTKKEAMESLTNYI